MFQPITITGDDKLWSIPSVSCTLLKELQNNTLLTIKGEHLPADQATKSFSQKGSTKQCGKNKQDQNGTHLCCVQKMKRTERNPSVSRFLT